MPAASFRLKLLLAMMLVVAGVTAATVLVTQRSVEATYRRIFQERFQSEVSFFAALQEARLAAVKTKGLELARSVRLIAVIEEDDTALLYQIALDELRDVLRQGPDAPGSGQGAGAAGSRQEADAAASPHATFFRFVSAAGEVLPPPDARAGLAPVADHSRWEEQIGEASRRFGGAGAQQVGYLAPEIGGRPELQEVILTRIVDPVRARALGTLAIGFPVEEFGAGGAPDPSRIRSGIWLEDQLYSRAIPAGVRSALAAEVAREAERGEASRGAAVHGDATRDAALPGEAARGEASSSRAGSAEPVRGEFTFAVEGVPHHVFYRAVHAQSHFPPAYQVGLYSMAESLAEQRTLGRKLLGFGSLALVLGLGLSLFISHGLSVPIRELVAGTGEIQRGNFDVKVPVHGRDEIGRLAVAFNEMAEGLALKERYRSVLNLVADERVAQELLRGEIALGGELREVTVLFCDIRGFTTLTEHMEPGEVIQLLNEHMTALTGVVHENNGVVDKFVGDSVMAIFGAPKIGGNDAYDAVRSAWSMITERTRLNTAGSYRIDIGVGIASGTVIAGCMGSADRLNYTVLGERVNLAARLCAQAGRMEVLIDDATRRRLAAVIGVEALPPVKLKGFSAPVAAYRLTEVGSLATAS